MRLRSLSVRLFVLFALATFLTCSAWSAEKPKLSTDKGRYKEGETVKISGSGWRPGESVTATIKKGDDTSSVTATADADGNFTATYTVGEVEATPEAAGVVIRISAEGSSGDASEFQFTAGPELGYAGDKDPDMPAFLDPDSYDKTEYLERRDEGTGKKRGLHRGRPSDPGSRGKAVREMNKKEGRSETSIFTAAQSADETIPPSATGTFGSSDPIGGLPGSSGPRWAAIGPAPLANGQTFGISTAVSGRVTSIALHPTNPNVAYVGTAQGGVYRTLDGGATWTAMMDNADTLAVGAVAISPSQPSTVYVGTGEGNFSTDSFFGVGLYRIDNADGASPVVSGPMNKNVAGTDVISGWSIDKIAVHPTDPNIVFIGTASGLGGSFSGASLNDTSAASVKPRGLFRSLNGLAADVRFTRMTIGGESGGNQSVTDLEFDPVDPNILLATVRGSSAAGGGGVYRSSNALAAVPTFTRTLATLTPGVLVRTEVSVSRNAGSTVVYAATADTSGTLFRSVDGGLTWSAALTGASAFCGGQCNYDMPIRVDPNDANVVYLGGAGDGAGATGILIKSTNALSATPTFTKVQNGLHADAHSIEIDPSNSKTVWFGSDGGVWKSFDAGTNWASLNKTGFDATQFVSLSLHPIDPFFTIGGTQDNGTEWQKPDNSWIRADFGDGGVALIDQNATNNTSVLMYHTYFNSTSNPNQIGFGRVTNVANATDGGWTFIGCSGGVANNGFTCTDAVNFYAPMALGPANINQLYFGTSRLYRSTNGGATMVPVSQIFNAAVPVSAIGISRQNDNVRIVGLNNGKVFATTTGANPMTDVSAGLPGVYVSRAVIDPNNQNTAYVTLSAFFNNATSHVWKTTNLNSPTPTWTASGSGIPDVPVSAFVVDPADSNSLYAGSDIGVFHSTDGGASWVPYSNGLPRVAIFDMAIHAPSRILRVATHGRGMWEVSIGATGNLQGTVTDVATGLPIAGATVIASKNTATNTTTTDAAGNYSFTGVAVGSYSVVASIPGYSAASANTSVTSGATTTQNLALAAAAVGACLTDTTKPDFEAGSGINVDTASSSGDVKLPSVNVVDQANTNVTNNGSGVTNTGWVAQTFTAGQTGNMIGINLSLFCSGCTNPAVLPNVILEVRDTVGGVPGANILGSASVAPFSSGSSSTKSFTFATPIPITAGTLYSFVLRIPSAFTPGIYAIIRGTANVSSYANGVAYSSGNNGATWSPSVFDYVFSTIMETRRFNGNGDLTSSLKDANPAPGSTVHWGSLAWTATTPAGTNVRFQVAASNSASGPFNFVGPDGTAGSFYTSVLSSLSQFNGKRYLKYKAYLASTDSSVGPTLHDVTICFNDIAPTQLAVAAATGTFGGTTNLSATLTSRGAGVAGKPITFTLNGNNVGTSLTDLSGTATVLGVSLTGIGAGSYPGAVTADFAGDNLYDPASGASALTVGKADQTIDFAPLGTKTFGDPDFNVSATATSGLSVSFAAAGDCTISGTLVHITGGGSCTITASQSGDSNWNAASDVAQSFGVAKANQTISFAALANKTLGDADFNVSASATSGLGVSFGATGSCTVTGTSVHLTGVGSCSITASQAGDTNYNPAPSVTRSFEVAYAACLLFDNTKSKQAGSTIPIKLSLCNSSGANVSSSSVVLTAVSLKQISTSASGVVQDSGNANPDNNFRYTAENGVNFYIFNLQTKGLAVGTWELTYRASGDNTNHTLTFQLK